MPGIGAGRVKGAINALVSISISNSISNRFKSYPRQTLFWNRSSTYILLPKIKNVGYNVFNSHHSLFMTQTRLEYFKLIHYRVTETYSDPCKSSIAECFWKKSQWSKDVNYFRKMVPSKIHDRVLNTPLGDSNSTDLDLLEASTDLW